MISRRALVALTGASLLLASQSGRTQAPVTKRRIAFLSAFPRATVDAFLTELRPELDKLAWTEGRNIELLEPRTTEGRNELLPSAAAEVISLGPDLILVQTVPATRALIQATKSIPIVMVGVGTPVELGLIADYAKPGGNVTGTSYLADELARKLMQFLKEAAPNLKSVALFINPSNEAAAALVRQTRADAMALGLRAQIVEVSSKEDFESAFTAIRRANTESILLPPEALIQANREAIGVFAERERLPLAVVGQRRVLPTSGLFAYGPAPLQYASSTARCVDRILKGTTPSEIPVEQPTRFSLVVNLKTAAALGLTISEKTLLLADEIIR